MFKIARLIPLISILLASGTAFAQFSAPIRYNEGPGLKITDNLVFHPGLEVEGRYDSNVLYTSASNPGAQLYGAPYLRIIGHLHLATLPPQRLTDGDNRLVLPKVSFRLKGAVAFREYFHDQRQVTEKRSLEVDAGIKLKLFPYGTFTVVLYDDFARTVPAWSGPNADRITNRGGVDFEIKPGGGRLNFTLGYANNLDLFEQDRFSFANKMSHELRLIAKWRLLPKTAAFFEANSQIYDYLDPTGGEAVKDKATGKAVPNLNSYPLRLFLGFAGLFTPRFSVLLKVGYGNSLHVENDSYNMLVALAEATFFISPLSKIKGGFEHNFADSFYGNYFVDERVYIGYDHFIINRILLHLKGEYRFRQHEGFPAGSSVQELNYHIITADFGLDYKILEWMYVGLGYNLEYRKQTTPALPSATGTYFNDFVKHQVFGKVGLSY